jgi:hypothetical protein
VNGTNSDNLVMDPALIGLDPVVGELRHQLRQCSLGGGRRRSSLALDLAGNPRSQVGAVDMGAYESPYPAPLHVVQVSVRRGQRRKRQRPHHLPHLPQLRLQHAAYRVLHRGGTASATDYGALSGSITLAANSDQVDVVVTPVNDALVEGSETVTLHLTADATYTLGTVTSAEGTIADNDFLLSLATAGTGSGTPGRRGDGVCSAGASITLSATPGAGSGNFVGWSAGCSAALSCPPAT